MKTIFWRMMMYILWGMPAGMPFFYKLLYWLFAPLLWCAQWFYGAGMCIVRWWQLRSAYRAHVPVISVGNLTAGGVGKSVFVQTLLSWISAYHAVVVMRGYGGSFARQRRPRLVEINRHSPYEVGDEAFALACKRKALVVVGGDKRQSVEYAQTLPGVRCIILDDGYQSWGIARDINIVLLDGRAPFGNRCLIPMGSLREKSLTRASHVVVTHAYAVPVEKRERLKKRIARYANGRKVPVFWAEHVVNGVYRSNSQRLAATQYHQVPVDVVVGIGEPAGFLKTVDELSVSVQKTHVFPDHHAYTVRDLEKILGTRERVTILTTEKDWGKIECCLAKNRVLLSRIELFVVRVALKFDSPKVAFLRQAIISAITKT